MLHAVEAKANDGLTSAVLVLVWCCFCVFVLFSFSFSFFYPTPQKKRSSQRLPHPLQTKPPTLRPADADDAGTSAANTRATSATNSGPPQPTNAPVQVYVDGQLASLRIADSHITGTGPEADAHADGSEEGSVRGSVDVMARDSLMDGDQQLRDAIASAKAARTATQRSGDDADDADSGGMCVCVCVCVCVWRGVSLFPHSLPPPPLYLLFLPLSCAHLTMHLPAMRLPAMQLQQVPPRACFALATAFPLRSLTSPTAAHRRQQQQQQQRRLEARAPSTPVLLLPLSTGRFHRRRPGTSTQSRSACVCLNLFSKGVVF